MAAQWRGYGPEVRQWMAKVLLDQAARMAGVDAPMMTYWQPIWRVDNLMSHQGALIAVKDLVPVKEAVTSRQTRYQQRHHERGLCQACPRPAAFGTTRCAAHLVTSRLAARRAAGTKPWRSGKPGRPPAEAVT